MPTTRLAVVAVLALASAAHHASAQTAVERELIQLERDWDAAFFRNDTAFIDRVLAPEFIATYPDGSRGDRAKELANVAAFNQQIDSSTLDEFTVQVYGDTAVVWFTAAAGRPEQGVAARGRPPLSGRVRAPRRQVAVRGDAKRQAARMRARER